MIQNLPICTIQPTIPTVLDEIASGLIPSEKIWISCYKPGETSVHARLTATLDDVDRDKILLKDNGKQGIDLTLDSGSGNSARCYAVKCPSLDIESTNMLFPVQEYDTSASAPQKATAFAVAPDISQFATGHLDGTIHFFPTTKLASSSPVKLKQNAISKTHKSSVLSLRYFPSSKVILSTSSDFSLSITSADPDTLFPTSAPQSQPVKVESARTLTGHVRAVTCAGMVGRGRKVVSGSLDGTLKVWDVSASQCVGSIGMDGTSGVTSLVLDSPSEGEQATVYAALNNGKWVSYDTRDATSSLNIQRGISNTGSLSSIACNPVTFHIMTGSSNGIVSLYDTRSPSTPFLSFTRSKTKIEDLAFFEGTSPSTTDVESMAITSEDGSPYLATAQPAPGSSLADEQCPNFTIAVQTELVGADCEPVRHIECQGKDAWTAGDDGMIRRYPA